MTQTQHKTHKGTEKRKKTLSIINNGMLTGCKEMICHNETTS